MKEIVIKDKEAATYQGNQCVLPARMRRIEKLFPDEQQKQLGNRRTECELIESPESLP